MYVYVHKKHCCLKVFATFFSVENIYCLTYQDIYFIKYVIILFDVLKALKFAFFFFSLNLFFKENNYNPPISIGKVSMKCKSELLKMVLLLSA